MIHHHPFLVAITFHTKNDEQSPISCSHYGKMINYHELPFLLAITFHGKMMNNHPFLVAITVK
jgi:hypothetical protein